MLSLMIFGRQHLKLLGGKNAKPSVQQAGWMKNMQLSGKMITTSPWYGCTKTHTLKRYPKIVSALFI